MKNLHCSFVNRRYCTFLSKACLGGSNNELYFFQLQNMLNLRVCTLLHHHGLYVSFIHLMCVSGALNPIEYGNLAGQGSTAATRK